MSCRREQHTILLIEDDHSIRETLSEVLSNEGYLVLCAGDGAQGLDIIRSNDKDICLILTDLLMPHVSGWHVIGEVLKSYSHIPVHAITATHHRNPLGVQFTKKPFTLDELLKTVAGYCTKRPTGEVPIVTPPGFEPGSSP